MFKKLSEQKLARSNFYDENLRKSREYSSIIKLKIMHSDKTSM